MDEELKFEERPLCDDRSTEVGAPPRDRALVSLIETPEVLTLIERANPENIPCFPKKRASD
jgi:hypothetical protein